MTPRYDRPMTHLPPTSLLAEVRGMTLTADDRETLADDLSRAEELRPE